MKHTVRVTAQNLPAIHDALECISHDSGARAGWDWYEVPTLYVPSLPIWEVKLSRMTEEERSAFCIGEESEQAEISRLYEAEQLAAFLTEFFNGGWGRGFSGESGVGQ